MNPFRILGDCSHLLSKCILIFAIHRNRSAEGVSMITQVLYAVVFCTRYTDLFVTRSTWNLFFKLFYIISSIYIIAIMRWRYPRTREREISWKLGAAVLGGSLLLSPFAMLIFEPKKSWSFFQWIWDFSEILESVCVLPQLLLLRQTTVPTVIDSFYLLALGSYRALYCLNWIWREADPNDRPPNAVSVIFGVIQTLLYVDFFWIYYTRQRVKLRGGGVVDADDIRRGWLLNRIFGNKRFDQDTHGGDDEESAPALGGHDTGNGHASSQQQQRRSKWGARGISVSADDTTLEQEHPGRSDSDEFSDAAVDPDAKMKDPDELARALDDDDSDSDDDDSDDDTPPSAAASSSHSDANRGVPSGVNNGNEWRDN
ncbi:ER lumen protein retaining receptor 2 [Biscogniauxia marginata]|nr:ER lumen protein retaining receptor 2 [Biscogniauxia marginata]